MKSMAIFSLLLAGCSENGTDKKTDAQDSLPEQQDTSSDIEDTGDVEETADDPPDNGDSSNDVSWDACDTEADAEMLSLPASESEAGQLVIIPEEGDTYILNKDANNEGWFVLEVSEWMCDIELYTEAGVTLTIEDSPNYDLGVNAEPVAECEAGNVFKNSWTFHGWGSYVVHVQAEGQTDLWLGSIMVFNK